jgi:hypothetical protein
MRAPCSPFVPKRPLPDGRACSVGDCRRKVISLKVWIDIKFNSFSRRYHNFRRWKDATFFVSVVVAAQEELNVAA